MEIADKIQSLSLVISRINGLSQQFVQKNGMNAYVVKVLYALSLTPEMTQRQISAACGMPKQTVNNVIRSLQKDGMVCLRQQENDRREKAVILTPQGKDYLSEILAPVMKVQDKVMEQMGAEAFERMTEALEMYSKIMEKVLEETI